MKTWKDVIKGFVCSLGVIIAVFFLATALMRAYETDMEIDSLQRDMEILRKEVEILKAKENYFVLIYGRKYLTILTKEKEVVIETTRGTR